jgi:cell pole-organizing protein PopZ
MEDILASIRKIISEDEPVAMESPEDFTPTSPVAVKSDVVTSTIAPFPSDNLASDSVVSAERESYSQSAEGDSVDIDIDDVLARLDADMAALETSAPTASAAAPAVVATPDLEFDAPELDGHDFDMDEDILSLLDDDIPLVADTVVPEAVIAPATPIASSLAQQNDDEMNDLLEDILAAPQDTLATTPDAVTLDLDIADTDIVESDLLDLDDLVSGIELNIPTDIPTDTPPAIDVQDVEPVRATSVRVESGEDLDLVKSLMADLADDPEAFSTESFAEDEDLDALLAIPDVEEISAVEPSFVEPVAVESTDIEDDILGDILDMTLEDQLQAQPDDIEVDHDLSALLPELSTSDDVAALEASNVIENDLVDMDDMLAAIDAPAEEIIVVDTAPSLADIAAAAEADAVAAETVQATAFEPLTALASVAAGGGGLAALHASSEAETVDLAAFEEVEPVLVEEDVVVPSEVVAPITLQSADPIIETPIPTQKMPSQETSMPVHAVNTDAILDEVTETAAAGAFAQLNTVVEDKAIFNERGPRIGDLVQEALRPMLKEWLDANLKGIVERAVTKEVKRISSGK